jgi:hypothetical protein
MKIALVLTAAQEKQLRFEAKQQLRSLSNLATMIMVNYLATRDAPPVKQPRQKEKVNVSL